MNDVVTTGGAPSFDISDYFTDPAMESNGVWRSIGKDKNGKVRRVKLARIGNDEYASALRKKQRANQALLEQNDDEAFVVAKTIAREVIAQTIIKGLEVDGVEVPYTYKVGLELLKNDDFLAKVQTLAQQAEAYRAAEEAEAVKS